MNTFILPLARQSTNFHKQAYNTGPPFSFHFIATKINIFLARYGIFSVNFVDNLIFFFFSSSKEKEFCFCANLLNRQSLQDTFSMNESSQMVDRQQIIQNPLPILRCKFFFLLLCLFWRM